MKKMVGIAVENEDPDMYNDAAKLPASGLLETALH